MIKSHKCSVPACEQQATLLGNLTGYSQHTSVHMIAVLCQQSRDACFDSFCSVSVVRPNDNVVWQVEVHTLSGFSRSAMAVPSARNSGLLRISKCTLGSEQFRLKTCTIQLVITFNVAAVCMKYCNLNESDKPEGAALVTIVGV